jgi:hypothetical protein
LSAAAALIVIPQTLMLGDLRLLAIADASEVLRVETRRFLAQNNESLELEFSRWGVFGRNDVLFASTEPAQW